MCKLIASAEMVVPSEGFSDPASQRSLVKNSTRFFAVTLKQVFFFVTFSGAKWPPFGWSKRSRGTKRLQILLRSHLCDDIIKPWTPLQTLLQPQWLFKIENSKCKKNLCPKEIQDNSSHLSQVVLCKKKSGLHNLYSCATSPKCTDHCELWSSRQKKTWFSSHVILCSAKFHNDMLQCKIITYVYL